MVNSEETDISCIESIAAVLTKTIGNTVKYKIVSYEEISLQFKKIKRLELSY